MSLYILTDKVFRVPHDKVYSNVQSFIVSVGWFHKSFCRYEADEVESEPYSELKSEIP